MTLPRLPEAPEANPDPRSPYGVDLAEAVAMVLEKGHWLAYHHPHYCGTGLAMADGQFVYDHVDDGYLRCGSPMADKPLLAFPDSSCFVAWLAASSDESLSSDEAEPGYANNQRITRARLEEFVERHG